MPKALIHIHRASNLGAALPFAHALHHTGQWELAWMGTPYDSTRKVGLPEESLSRFRRIGIQQVESPRAYAPDVTFTFEAVEASLDCGGIFVRLPSGVSSSGHRYGGRQESVVDNLADLMLLPGPWHEDRIRQAGHVFTSLETVGLPSLDPLTANWLPGRDVFCQQLRIDPARSVILFAPGYKPETSALPILWSRIGRLADDSTQLIIKLHPYTPDDARTAIEALAEKHPHVILAREEDVQPYLRTANLVVSDTSSIAFEAAAIGIPVVLFDNPNQKEDPSYDPRDPEYALRSSFPTVSDLGGLQRETRRLLQNPAGFAETSHKIRTHLVRVDQGTATQRILEATLRHLAQSKQPAAGQSRVTIVMPTGHEPSAAVEASLETVLDERSLSARSILLTEAVRSDEFSGLRRRWPGRVEILDYQELQNHLPGTPFLAVMRPGVRLGRKGLTRLVNLLRRQQEQDGCVPLMPGAAPAQDPRILLRLPAQRDLDPLALDRELVTSQAGVSTKPAAPVSTDMIVLRRGSDTVVSVLGSLMSGRSVSMNRISVAVDTVASHPDWHAEPLWEKRAPLTHAEINEAERRIRELSQWIGRIVPKTGRSSENRFISNSIKTSTGRLRLALHYERQGNHEQALRHLEAHLRQHPGDTNAKELADRLGGSKNLNRQSGGEG
jgi:hypothetical protein